MVRASMSQIGLGKVNFKCNANKLSLHRRFFGIGCSRWTRTGSWGMAYYTYAESGWCQEFWMSDSFAEHELSV